MKLTIATLALCNALSPAPQRPPQTRRALLAKSGIAGLSLAGPLVALPEAANAGRLQDMAAAREAKKSGGKKKDCYFLLLSDLANRIKGDDAQMAKVNACLESASVFRMQNSDKDMTKCMSYRSCNKDCDGGCDWPSGTTTSTTTTSTTTTRVANSAKTFQ